MKFLFAIIVVIASSSFVTPPDCKKVKNGTFIIPMDQIEGMEGQYSRLQRKGKYQTETTSFDDSESRFTIKWLNDCTYLLFDEVTIKGENLYRLKPTDTLKVEIFDVTSEFYEAYVTSTFADMKLEAKVLIDK